MSSSYPKWLYHAKKDAVIVQNEEEHRALGSEWVESPADIQKAPEPKSNLEAQHAHQAAHPHPVVEHKKGR